MVHGIFHSSGNFRWMKKRLEARGIVCHAIDLKPNTGFAPIESLAEQLLHFIEDRTAPDSDLSLIGFSMGTLVSRYYLQCLEGHQRINRFFSIAGPHHGTLCAYLWPGKGTAQMRPNSPFLSQLNQSDSILEDMPVFSYRTPFDNVIIPSSSSHWDRAHNLTFNIISHQYMPFSRQILNHILTHIPTPTHPTQDPMVIRS